MLLGDDIMVDDGELLRSMLDVHERVRPLGARAARGDAARRSRRTAASSPRTVDDGLVRGASRSSRSRRREDAPSNLAVIGRYVFTPEIFDALDRIEPGVGGELQLTDAIDAARSRPEPVLRPACSRDGRYDIGQKLDFLRANVELALDRPDLGPELADVPARARARRGIVVIALDVIPLADVAGDTILGAVAPLAPRRRSRCADALGLVLAADVVATEPVPPFANTAMDGYAVRAADTDGAADGAPVRLRVVGELAGRHAPTIAVGPGEAIRIMTGAPMPDGADAIVMVERTDAPTASDDGVLIALAVEPGRPRAPAGRRPRGRRRRVRAGHRARRRRTSACSRASTSPRCACHPRPRVGVLRPATSWSRRGPLAPGKIRDSNRPMLLALLADAGAEPVDLGIARDDEADVMTAHARRRGRRVRRGASRAAGCRSATTTS